MNFFRDEHKREVGFKVIIWATDGSSGAEQALLFAKGLARTYGARLIVAHVKEIMVGRTGGYPVNVDEGQVQAAILKQVEDLKQEGFDATLQMASAGAGGAAHVIAEIADDAGADLIVAGTRGYGPLAGLLLGSVTHRLLHVAHCAVLVVPPKSAGASAS
jgi:nucleotide-binding universal stress UspA family protein